MSGGDALLRDLAAYAPSDERERAMVDRMRLFVRENESCFERSLAIGHVTGSAWIVDRAGTAAVLTHHRKLGKWLQLGGHADGDGDIRRVAMREAVEESGLRSLTLARHEIYDIDVHTIPARSGEPAHEHYDVRFALIADRMERPVASDESHAVAWIPFVEIERYGIDESVRRLVAKTPVLLGRDLSS